ncbi:hypothetical protein VTG60DRAFT_5809 [Thermothelomyces hinnuleus]
MNGIVWTYAQCQKRWTSVQRRSFRWCKTHVQKGLLFAPRDCVKPSVLPACKIAMHPLAWRLLTRKKGWTQTPCYQAPFQNRAAAYGPQRFQSRLHQRDAIEHANLEHYLARGEGRGLEEERVLIPVNTLACGWVASRQSPSPDPLARFVSASSPRHLLRLENPNWTPRYGKPRGNEC